MCSTFLTTSNLHLIPAIQSRANLALYFGRNQSNFRSTLTYLISGETPFIYSRPIFHPRRPYQSLPYYSFRKICPPSPVNTVSPFIVYLGLSKPPHLYNLYQFSTLDILIRTSPFIFYLFKLPSFKSYGVNTYGTLHFCVWG